MTNQNMYYEFLLSEDKRHLVLLQSVKKWILAQILGVIFILINVILWVTHVWSGLDAISIITVSFTLTLFMSVITVHKRHKMKWVHQDVLFSQVDCLALAYGYRYPNLLNYMSSTFKNYYKEYRHYDFVNDANELHIDQEWLSFMSLRKDYQNIQIIELSSHLKIPIQSLQNIDNIATEEIDIIL